MLLSRISKQMGCYVLANRRVKAGTETVAETVVQGVVLRKNSAGGKATVMSS